MNEKINKKRMRKKGEWMNKTIKKKTKESKKFKE
jgi:hypothetical protein